ncbi:Period circadian protein-like 2 [Acipenser ruthenus]|uniref:Period circadian protein-like 2 n=1 Tax=Acipenser ruthenus TaxID=7906 RepID=A0A444U696_ACIRT|nr:Period circadian protein-like 2 [Acipenser ruthenus]
MSEGYLYSTLEGQSSERDPDFEDAPACSASRPRLHRMSSFSEARHEEAELVLHSDGSDSSQDRRAPSPRQGLHSDMEMTSSGSSGNDSHGNESSGSSSGNGKDSALLESSESNKSVNSQSPSPPSSSNAFSLLSASSEPDNPSTSGCSSEESAKAKTQKELLKTLKQLKVRLPSEKRAKGKSSTLATLNYALRCVKQVKANEEYYQLLMINESQPSGLDVSSYTIEEIDNITSEYTLKNNDIFAVAVSLITGKIVFISDQAACILNCKREVFRNAKFVEFLSPQDVSVFYSFTAPYRLPSWSMCSGAESSPPDSMQEKSFFCRISGGRERAGEMQYCPFRMTPYLMKVQHSEHAEDHFSCLLLAERVHSGYEAPRIPADKRIFTTTHTPSCMFEDVDERVVPLLGYLPQDLIGTPVLLYLHPSDRHLMLAVHKKTEPQKDSNVRTKDTLLISGNGNATGISEKTTNSEEISNKEQTVYSYQQISCLDSVIRKMNFAISEIMEEGPSGIEPVESQPPPPPASAVPAVSQEKEAYKKRGLTKEVLAAHTQQEEKAFLSKFKEPQGMRMFQSPCSFYLQEKHKGHKCTQTPRQRGQDATKPPFKKAGRNKKTKSKRVKQRDSSDSTSSHNQQPHRPPLVGLNHTPWSLSETSQSSYPAMSFPTVVPAYPMPVLTAPGAMPPATNPSMSGFGDGQSAQDNCSQMQPPQYSAPLVTPMVAFVLPNYMFPQMNSAVHSSFYPGQPSFPPHPTFSAQAAFPVPSAFPGQPQFGAPNPNVFQAYPQFPGQPFHYNMPMESEQRDGPSRSSTPQSVGAQDQASPPLFQSRCSSPLQLNLLQLEETPKRVERQEAGPSAMSLGVAGTAGDRDKGAAMSKEPESGESPGEGQVSDVHSTSSDLLDILLQEDSRSGTGSAASGSGRSADSGSLGSGSNGCGTSGSGTGSSQTSNTSKYFGSIDSSENDHQLQGKTGMEKKEGTGFVKYVLQDPMWLLISNADDSVMMTYQVPTRDFETVLKEDRDKLKQMQKAQPKFRTEQKSELVEVHPWMKKGVLPEALDVAECLCSVESTQGGASTAFDVDIQNIELCAMVKPSEEGSLRTLSVTNEEQIHAEASPMS